VLLFAIWIGLDWFCGACLVLGGNYLDDENCWASIVGQHFGGWFFVDGSHTGGKNIVGYDIRVRRLQRIFMVGMEALLCWGLFASGRDANECEWIVLLYTRLYPCARASRRRHKYHASTCFRQWTS